jgi:hypothetical protein
VRSNPGSQLIAKSLLAVLKKLLKTYQTDMFNIISLSLTAFRPNVKHKIKEGVRRLCLPIQRAWRKAPLPQNGKSLGAAWRRRLKCAIIWAAFLGSGADRMARPLARFKAAFTP